MERFVKYRIGNPSDAEDILQEILIAAYRGAETLSNEASFKPWILGIKKCMIPSVRLTQARMKKAKHTCIGTTASPTAFFDSRKIKTGSDFPDPVLYSPIFITPSATVRCTSPSFVCRMTGS